jgi:hypothetical protein
MRSDFDATESRDKLHTALALLIASQELAPTARGQAIELVRATLRDVLGRLPKTKGRLRHG